MIVQIREGLQAHWVALHAIQVAERIKFCLPPTDLSVMPTGAC